MLDLKSLIPWGQKSRVPVRHNTHDDPLMTFRREVDRLFDDFMRGVNGFGSRDLIDAGDGWSYGVPSIDVTYSDRELVISAELPGVNEKDVDVTLSCDVLTIRGEKKHEHEEKDGDRYYAERSYGTFSRSVRLPFEAGDQDVNAEFSKGVLTIRIPKPADVQNKVKQIEVKAH